VATNTALAEHSHLLKVPEPSQDETVEILRVHKPHVEADYELIIADEALAVTANLAERYLADAVLPASACTMSSTCSW
jgi:ATP-dependent Clp protease ATP-binding subunit ClpA